MNSSSTLARDGRPALRYWPRFLSGRLCASPQSKTHQEQCVLKSSLTSGSNFSVALNARPAGLFRNRLNERTLLSSAQTNESLRTADSSSPVVAVMQPAHALLANHGTLFQPVSWGWMGLVRVLCHIVGVRASGKMDAQIDVIGGLLPPAPARAP